MKEFRPLLFPNDKIVLSEVTFPMLASTKLDGIRTVFKDGKMLSRSLKEIPNAQLQKKFQNLKDYSKKHNVILDGELYGLHMSFQEITHFVMTDDLENEVLPEKLKFFCFDIIENSADTPFIDRYNALQRIVNAEKWDDVVLVKQKLVISKEEVEAMFNEVIEDGFEGLILKSKTGIYKFGRITAKSGDGYKIKPWITIDSQIIAIEERFENLNESQTNELGRSFKRNTLDAKKGTGIAACFVVIYEGQEQRVMITGTEEFRKEIWDNQSKYIGTYIEWRGMTVGSKDLIRHPVFIRHRSDK